MTLPRFHVRIRPFYFLLVLLAVTSSVLWIGRHGVTPMVIGVVLMTWAVVALAFLMSAQAKLVHEAQERVQRLVRTQECMQLTEGETEQIAQLIMSAVYGDPDDLDRGGNAVRDVLTIIADHAVPSDRVRDAVAPSD